jgi:hypothetical protein
MVIQPVTPVDCIYKQVGIILIVFSHVSRLTVIAGNPWSNEEYLVQG